MYKMIALVGLGVALSVALFMASCRGNIDEFVPYSDSSQEINALLNKIPESSAQTSFVFTGGLSKDTTLVTASGVRVLLFSPNDLFEDKTGAAVRTADCGAFRLELKEYIKGGSLLAAGFPLEVGGVLPDTLTGLVHLEAWCGSTALRIRSGAQIKVQIPSASIPTTVQASDIFMFYADFDANNQVQSWLPSGQEVFFAQWPDPKNPSATLRGFDLSFHATGLAGGFGFPDGNLGKFCVEMPEYYTNKNTAVFMFFSNGSTSIPLDYDASSGFFCAEGIPNGLNVDLAAISRLGNQWQYATKPATTGASSVFIEQENASESDILQSMRGF